jgi:hypothetical protein
MIRNTSGTTSQSWPRIRRLAYVGAAAATIIAGTAIVGPQYWANRQEVAKITAERQSEDQRIAAVEKAIKEEDSTKATRILTEYDTQRVPLPPGKRAEFDLRIQSLNSGYNAFKQFEEALKNHDTQTAATTLEQAIKGYSSALRGVSQKWQDEQRARIKTIGEPYMLEQTLLANVSKRIAASKEYLAAFPKSEERKHVIERMMSAYSERFVDALTNLHTLGTVTDQLKEITQTATQYKDQVDLPSLFPQTLESTVDSYLERYAQPTGEPVTRGKQARIVNPYTQSNGNNYYTDRYLQERNDARRSGRVGTVVDTYTDDTVVVQFDTSKNWGGRHRILREYAPNAAPEMVAVYNRAELEAVRQLRDIDTRHFKDQAKKLYSIVSKKE